MPHLIIYVDLVGLSDQRRQIDTLQCILLRYDGALHESIRKAGPITSQLESAWRALHNLWRIAPHKAGYALERSSTTMFEHDITHALGAQFQRSVCRSEDLAELIGHNQNTSAQPEETIMISTPNVCYDRCGYYLPPALEYAHHEQLEGLYTQTSDPRSSIRVNNEHQAAATTAQPLSLESLDHANNESGSGIERRKYASSHSDGLASFHTALSWSDRASRVPAPGVETNPTPKAVNDLVQRVLKNSSKFLSQKADDTTQALLHASVQRYLKDLLAIDVSIIPAMVHVINDLALELCEIVSAGSNTTSGMIKLRSAVARDALDFVVDAGRLTHVVASIEEAYEKNFKVISLEPRTAFSIQWIQHLRENDILLDPTEEMD